MNFRTRTIALQMVMAFVVMLLLVQLWLFTEALEAIPSPDGKIVLAAVISSGISCLCVWWLIRFFINAEKATTVSAQVSQRLRRISDD